MTDVEVLPDDEAIVGTTSVSARRIGLIGDDHNANEDGSDLPDEVLAALDGVDLVIHLGHMGAFEILGRGVLDRLAEVAPVLGVRDYSTNNDRQPYITPADGNRVAGLTRIIDANGIRIGAVHNLERPPGPAIATPPGGLPDMQGVKVSEMIADKFGGPVDVVAYAGSHRPAAIHAQGVLFVNPGSPTFPKGLGRVAGTKSLGTVGILELGDESVTFETIELSLLRDAG